MKLPRIPKSETILAVSSVMTLVGLALMCWGVLQPTVLPVMLAMTVGQAIGTLAFTMYLFCIARDLRRRIRGEAK